MLDRSAPACRGSAPILFPLILLALASFPAGAKAQEAAGLSLASAAPPLALDTLDHGRRELAALHGRPVLIHFFATWCEPCREEMAGLRRLSQRLEQVPEARHPAILAVDVGEPLTRIRRFFDDIGAQVLPFPVLIDEDRTAMKAWKVAVLPTSYVLGADHTIRLAAAGPVDWDDARAVAALDLVLADRPLPVDLTLPALPDTIGSNQP